MRKHQLVSRQVKFELIYISSLPKSITCTEQVSYRSDLSQHQCRRQDLSPRCVAAICRIVCLCLKTYSVSSLVRGRIMMFDLQDVVLLLKLEASNCKVRSSGLAFTFTGATEYFLTHQNNDLIYS